MRINDNLSQGDVDELFRDQPEDPEADTDIALLKKLQGISQISELHSSGHLLDLSQQQILNSSRRMETIAGNLKSQGQARAKATVKVVESRRPVTPNDPDLSTERKKVGQVGNKIMEFPSFDLSMSKIELQSFIQQQDQEDQQSSQFGATTESILKFTEGVEILQGSAQALNPAVNVSKGATTATVGTAPGPRKDGEKTMVKESKL